MNAMNGVAASGAASVAVLVDGENVAAQYGAEIFRRAEGTGAVRIRRVYGNAALLPGWDAAPGFDLIHTGSGKNSADMKLAIDAVDMAARGMARHFLIVSSDADFTHLARHLRERGFNVTGMGEAKTAEGFRRACDLFHVLAERACRPAKETATEAKVRRLIEEEGENGVIDIARLGGRMHSLNGIRAAQLAEMSWRAFLTARPHLFRCDPRGPSARVRLVARSSVAS